MVLRIYHPYHIGSLGQTGIQINDLFIILRVGHLDIPGDDDRTGGVDEVHRITAGEHILEQELKAAMRRIGIGSDQTLRRSETGDHDLTIGSRSVDIDHFQPVVIIAVSRRSVGKGIVCLRCSVMSSSNLADDDDLPAPIDDNTTIQLPSHREKVSSGV